MFNLLIVDWYVKVNACGKLKWVKVWGKIEEFLNMYVVNIILSKEINCIKMSFLIACNIYSFKEIL